MIKVDNLTISEIQKKLQKREFSCTDLVNHSLDRIKNLDKKVKAFITVIEEEALEKAKRVDSKIEKRIRLKSLEGIPYSAKDVFCTKGIETTAGSKILKGFIPPYDASVIKRVDEQGA